METLPLRSSNRLPIDVPPLSLHQITTYHWSLLDAVTEYQDSQIPSIGLWRFKLDDFGKERSIELLNDSELTVSSLSWAGEFTGAKETRLSDSLQEARETILLAEQLNAPTVVIASGSRNGHTHQHALSLLLEALAALCEFADQHNVTLALQPMHQQLASEWTFLTTLDQTLNVLDVCQHPRLKLAFDVWHLWREPNLLERIPELIPYTAIVQLSDSPQVPQSLNDRQQLGHGTIPLQDIVQTFQRAGYSGPYEVILQSPEIWKCDYKQLIEDCKTKFATIFCP